jgi:hypothetical protein
MIDDALSSSVSEEHESLRSCAGILSARLTVTTTPSG